MELQLLGQSPVFPQVTYFKYLLDILSDMGYGFSTDGLTFQEIESFLRMTNIELSQFEIVALRNLSLDYLSMLNRAKDKNCEAPYKLDKI